MEILVLRKYPHVTTTKAITFLAFWDGCCESGVSIPACI